MLFHMTHTLALLPDWRQSCSANVEIELATHLGMPVIPASGIVSPQEGL